jgi:hypothetical protein
MSLSAQVYRRLNTIDIGVGPVTRNDLTGEYYFPSGTTVPSDGFIASEFWIGNITGVAELREELRKANIEQDSLLLNRVLYSGTHSGDVIELSLLPALEQEVRRVLVSREMHLSEYLTSVLQGILELIEAAKREDNPIVFV